MESTTARDWWSGSPSGPGWGFQNGVIFPEYFSEFAGGLLQNGMTAGGLVATPMTLFAAAGSGKQDDARLQQAGGADVRGRCRFDQLVEATALGFIAHDRDER